MRNFFNFTVPVFIFYMAFFSAELQAQSLIFRMPYGNQENPLFNPAFSGGEGTFRAQYMVAKTSLPANDIHTFSADGQIFRSGREHIRETGFVEYLKPELFITGGVNFMRYAIKDSYAYQEVGANVGVRLHIPTNREKAESNGKGHIYQAIKRNSSNFLAINYHETNVQANLFQNSFIFNDDIAFDVIRNNFNVNSGTTLDTENIQVRGISALAFLSIIPPKDTKPDDKPVLYAQMGYRTTFNNPDALLVDYKRLRLANVDVHFVWPFGNPDKIQDALSMTLSYVRILQNNSRGVFSNFFENAEISQDRLITVLHFQNETALGLDVGFEYTLRQHYAGFVNVNYRNEHGYFRAMFSGGIPTDRFDDITLRGNNDGLNYQLGLSYSTITKKRSGTGAKARNKGKSNSKLLRKTKPKKRNN